MLHVLVIRQALGVDHAWIGDGRPTNRQGPVTLLFRQGDTGDLQDYITSRYLGLIRNFRRYSWLLVYLFGASPAVCASFLRGTEDHTLQAFDAENRSFHQPLGTALRMGDLGYSSNAQKNLSVCYNNLDSYITTLREAITQPHPEYERIGIGDNGHQRQLNTSLLQIENEFYSPIRPKRVAHSGETPLGALRRGGIEYVEVRCVDVSPYHPLGMDAEQARFIDAFLLHCLLSEAAPCDDEDRSRIAANLQLVVNRGREPGLKLDRNGEQLELAEWARQLVEEISTIGGILDAAEGGSAYASSCETQAKRVENPDLTPSARILADMQEQDIPFFRLAMNASLRWAEEFRAQPLEPERDAYYRQVAQESLEKQSQVEASDDISFETYLENFYRQYDSL